MSHEIAGVIATSAIILVALWIVSLSWSLADMVRNKRPKWWAAVALIVPLAGAFVYYIYASRNRPKASSIGDMIKNRWVIIAIIIIMLLSMYVRLIDYRWPYLRNIDSYVFYRWMDETVQNNGILPTLDVYERAPVGFYRPPQWVYPYFYLGAYSYMLVNSFVNVPLWEFLIYFPPFLATLAAIPLYFIGKLLYDRKAGVLAAFFYTFEISNISRSLGGDPDSDAIVILVSMVTIAAMIFTYKYASTAKALDKRLILYSVLTSVILWIWYSTWAGYWYVTWLFFGVIALRVIFSLVKRRNVLHAWHDTKYILISFAIFTTLSFAMTVPSYGDTKITSALAGPMQFQSIKGEEQQFPNVYVSVAELQQSGGPKEIIERTSVVGGPATAISPFFLLAYAIIYLFYSISTQKKELDRLSAAFLWFFMPFLMIAGAFLSGNLIFIALFFAYLIGLSVYMHGTFTKTHNIDTIILLSIWFIGPLLATTVAVRFSILFSAPLAVGSAIILSKFLRMATGEDKGFGD